MIKATAITGPTASGKTSLSLDIAEALGCEIISCDSMQIYKEMDIGTAKATADEQARVRHHLIDVISPSEAFSANSYREMALRAAEDIASRGKIPLFVGGTGLYLATLMRGECPEVPESDPEYRRQIEEKIISEEDKLELHKRLGKIDPVSADTIHYNNVRRVIRALEIYDATGKPKSYFDELSRRPSDKISIKHVTLDFHKRETLYARADARVEAMLRDGLEAEVRSLLDRGLLDESTTASQAIGYKELVLAIRGDMSVDAAVAELKQATRNYAKRQLTWFRHDGSAVRVYRDREDGTLRDNADIFSECMNIFKEFISE